MGKYQARLNESISVLSSEELADRAYAGLMACMDLVSRGRNGGIIEAQLNSGRHMRKLFAPGCEGPVIAEDMDPFQPLRSGLYIPGTQRTFWSGYFDLGVDDPPERGTVIVNTKKDDDLSFQFVTVVRIKRFPARIICGCKSPVLFYKAYHTMIWKDTACIPAHLETFFAIDRNGDMWSTRDRMKLRYGRYRLPLSDRWEIEYTPSVNIAIDEEISHFGPGALSLLADRKYLWNVRTVEPIRDIECIVDFGIEPEMIKSLLYARTLPRTETGRLRPILHWVSAHKRRLQMGTDIDIRKHLRGIEVFQMENLRFEITEPTKESIRRTRWTML